MHAPPTSCRLPQPLTANVPAWARLPTNQIRVIAIFGWLAVASADGGSANAVEPVALTNIATLRLTILAADVDKPVPGVEVECDAQLEGATRPTLPFGWRLPSPMPKGSPKFVSRREGICEVHYPSNITALELVSHKDGFADTTLHWDPDRGDPVPSKYTLRLVRAVHIGGFVRASHGSPAAGAKVEFTLLLVGGSDASLTHDYPGVHFLQTEADAEGRWRLDRIAPRMLRVFQARAYQPDLGCSDFERFDSAEAQEQLRKEAFVFKLNPPAKLLHGLHGRVVDAQGKPIVNATISFHEPPYMIATSKSQADGSFRIVQPKQPGPTLITFVADGLVPKVVRFEAKADSTPLEVVLESGRPLPLKVVDQSGRAVAGARISEDLPGGGRRELARTHDDGTATLGAGPDGPMALSIEAQGFELAKASLSADGKEHAVVLAREAGPVVSGTVTDAVSGRPIPLFLVISGKGRLVQLTNLVFESWGWNRFGSGKFRLDLSGFVRWLKRPGGSKNGVDNIMLRFEAEGYAPALSRAIRADEGAVQLKIALMPAASLKVTVLNPDGQPAADTEVGLKTMLFPWFTISQTFHFREGATRDLETDSRGAFSLPPDDSLKQVAAINSNGVAIVSVEELRRKPVLRLQPFGRVEGRWAVGNQPVSGRKVSLSASVLDKAPFGLAGPGGGGAGVGWSASTDAQGRFSISRLPAQKYQLWSDEGWQSGRSVHLAEVEVRPGETSTLVLGGYLVSLRLRGPEGGPVPRKNTQVFMQGPQPRPGEQWTDALRKDHVSYDFVEGADGRWTAEGVRAGTYYRLVARVLAEPATNRSPVIIASEGTSLAVPAEPPWGILDAGELVLRRVK